MQSGASRYISLLPSPRLFRDLAHPSPSASGHPGPPSLLVSWASIMAVLLLLLLRQCAQAGWGSLWAVAAMPSPAGSSPLKLEEGGLGHLHSLPARGLPLPFPPEGWNAPGQTRETSSGSTSVHNNVPQFPPASCSFGSSCTAWPDSCNQGTRGAVLGVPMSMPRGRLSTSQGPVENSPVQFDAHTRQFHLGAKSRCSVLGPTWATASQPSPRPHPGLAFPEFLAPVREGGCLPGRAVAGAVPGLWGLPPLQTPEPRGPSSRSEHRRADTVWQPLPFFHFS